MPLAVAVLVAYHFQESAMNARVIRKFWVESRSHRLALAHYYRVAACTCQNFDLRPSLLDARGTNENHLHWAAGESGFSFTDGTVELPSIGVAPNTNVEHAQAGLIGIGDFAGEHDGASAGAEGGLETNEIAQSSKTFRAEDFQEGPRLAAGNHEAVDLVELLGLADEDHLGAELLEPLLVGVEITLDG